MSRITNNMMISDFLSNYNKSQNKLNKYMNQLSTGDKFSRISEEPIDAVKSMRLDTTLSFNQQYQDNAEGGISWLKLTDEALNEVVKTLRTLRTDAVAAATGTMNPESRQKVQQKVDQLREHLVEIANTKYADSYIFNGVKTKVKPYQGADSLNPTDYEANGAVSTGKLDREVGAGTVVDINVTGPEIGFGQIFADIYNFSEALANDDSAEIQNSLDNIDTHIENVLVARSQVGARQNRLELGVDRLSAQEVTYTDILSKTADTDVAETIMKYKNEENVFRIALATGAGIMQPTLMDFLT
ncbi:MAG: flagellar hook-associated protein 3 [Firmicutes bacterium]|nr:flagellar hook-associated protein 3 [Bacillota bacterium]